MTPHRLSIGWASSFFSPHPFLSPYALSSLSPPSPPLPFPPHSTAFAQVGAHDTLVPPPPALIAVAEPCSLQSRTVRIADAPPDTNIVLTDANSKVAGRTVERGRRKVVQNRGLRRAALLVLANATIKRRGGPV